MIKINLLLLNPMLEIKILLYQSIHHYGPDLDGQAIFYTSHKITVLVWPVFFSKGLSTLDV